MKKLYTSLPETPGVYLMKNGKGEILYVGKAGNLRRRVSSYFLRGHEYRIERLVREIKKIDTEKTDTAIEALILEAELIKKHQPPFNILEKDDKSFLYVEIIDDVFPYVLLARGKTLARGGRYGPFTSVGSLKHALRIIRKIFPYATHPPGKIGNRPCFDYQIGLCPGTCVDAISKEEYAKIIRNLKLFFSGKKAQILKHLKQEMKIASKELAFERAAELKRTIFALQHIQDIALIEENKVRDVSKKSEMRIEGYDISNISGTSAVGSMVVFVDGKPTKSEYRKFRIQTLHAPNDIGMLKEVLRRRFSRTKKEGDWPLPDLLLIDGGIGQVRGAQAVLFEKGLKLPVIGIAKGKFRKNNTFSGPLPPRLDPKVLIRVRDEAHRFAVSYHRKLRGRRFFN